MIGNELKGFKELTEEEKRSTQGGYGLCCLAVQCKCGCGGYYIPFGSRLNSLNNFVTASQYAKMMQNCY
jgi:hypothetical protein